MPTLYNCRSSANGSYMIAKFDAAFNVAAVYTLSPRGPAVACDCPAGPRPSCKHRKMLPLFAAAGAIDTPHFYCYETQLWHQPIPSPDGPIDAAKLNAAMAQTDLDLLEASPLAGEGPGPSTLAATTHASPSREHLTPAPGGRGQPASSSPLRRL